MNDLGKDNSWVLIVVAIVFGAIAIYFLFFLNSRKRAMPRYSEAIEETEVGTFQDRGMLTYGFSSDTVRVVSVYYVFLGEYPNPDSTKNTFVQERMFVPHVSTLGELKRKFLLRKEANNDTLIVSIDSLTLCFLLSDNHDRKLPEALRRDSLQQDKRQEVMATYRQAIPLSEIVEPSNTERIYYEENLKEKKYIATASYFLFDSSQSVQKEGDTLMIDDIVFIAGRTSLLDLQTPYIISKKANTDTLVIRKNGQVLYFQLTGFGGVLLPETVRRDSL